MASVEEDVSADAVGADAYFNNISDAGTDGGDGGDAASPTGSATTAGPTGGGRTGGSGGNPAVGSQVPLSNAAIAGIVVGAALGRVALLLAVAVCLWKSRAARKTGLKVMARWENLRRLHARIEFWVRRWERAGTWDLQAVGVFSRARGMRVSRLGTSQKSVGVSRYREGLLGMCWRREGRLERPVGGLGERDYMRWNATLGERIPFKARDGFIVLEVLY